MVKKEHDRHRSLSFRIKKMFEVPGRQAHSLIFDSSNRGHGIIENQFRSQGSRSAPVESIGALYNRSSDVGPVSCLGKEGNRGGNSNMKNGQPSDTDMMKERFAKLLLGEDMSGGGKGVSSALALSNAITNLAASVFGEQRKLEPMAPDRKARWKREMDWLLSVTDYIVEFVASQQTSQDGTNMEIMVTQQRRDLLVNIPALRKLDTMLLDCLDNFGDQNEFWYVKRDADDSEQGSKREDKWWLPTVKVPPEGLSDVTRKWLQFQKDSVNQVLKASMAINAQILSEMEIPESYIESLPKRLSNSCIVLLSKSPDQSDDTVNSGKSQKVKTQTTYFSNVYLILQNGRSSLGDSTYKSITVEFFDPEEFLSNMDLSTEHKVLDLKNRIEASIVIWKRKMHHKDGKSSWGSGISTGISMEKRELFEERVETILLLLKHRFPGIPQSSLDISKIQYNKDVGLAILESYSRVLESLANTVLCRIEDVLYADSRSQDSPGNGSFRRSTEMRRRDSSGTGDDRETPGSMTLSDFMGWHLEGESKMKKNDSGNYLEGLSKDANDKLGKPPSVSTKSKFSYMEKLESLGGLRSPTRY